MHFKTIPKKYLGNNIFGTFFIFFLHIFLQKSLTGYLIFDLIYMVELQETEKLIVAIIDTMQVNILSEPGLNTQFTVREQWRSGIVSVLMCLRLAAGSFPAPVIVKLL